MTKIQMIAALRLLGWETYICTGNERPAALRMPEPNSFEGYTFTPKTSVLHSVGQDQLAFVRAHVPGMGWHPDNWSTIHVAWVRAIYKAVTEHVD